MGNNLSNLSYAKSEEYIKTYRYNSTSTKDKEVGEVEKKLIVTNKRIILEATNKSGFNRDEFSIDLIERIDTNFYHSKKNLIGLILLVLGIIIFSFAFVMGEKLDEIFSGSYYILIGVGSLLGIVGVICLVLKKSKQSFRLTFLSTKQFYNFSSISGENFSIRERKSSKHTKKIKVVSKVTPSAVVMLNELNALLIDIKDFNFQINYAKQMVLSKSLSPDEFDNHYQFLINKIVNLYK